MSMARRNKRAKGRATAPPGQDVRVKVTAQLAAEMREAVRRQAWTQAMIAEFPEYIGPRVTAESEKTAKMLFDHVADMLYEKCRADGMTDEQAAAELKRRVRIVNRRCGFEDPSD